MNGHIPISSGQHNSRLHIHPADSSIEHSNGMENTALPDAASGTQDQRGGNSNIMLRRMRRSNESIVIHNNEILFSKDLGAVDKDKFRDVTLDTIQKLAAEKKLPKLTAPQIENTPTSILESMTPEQVAEIDPETWRQLNPRTREALIHYKERIVANGFEDAPRQKEFREHYFQVKKYLKALPGTHLSALEDRVFSIFTGTEILEVITVEKIPHIAPEKFVKICKDWSFLTSQHVQAMEPKVFALASPSQLMQLSPDCRQAINSSQISQINLQTVPDQFLLGFAPPQVRALRKISQISPTLFYNFRTDLEYQAAYQRKMDAEGQLRIAVAELDSLLFSGSFGPRELTQRIRDTFWTMEEWRVRNLGVVQPVLDDQGQPRNAQVEFEAAQRELQTLLSQAEATQEPGQIARLQTSFQEIRDRIQERSYEYAQRLNEIEGRRWTRGQEIAQFMMALDGTQISKLTGRHLQLLPEAWATIKNTLEAQANRYAAGVSDPTVDAEIEKQVILEAKENRNNAEREKPKFKTRSDERDWLGERRKKELQWMVDRTRELKRSGSFQARINSFKAKIAQEEFIRLAKDFFEKFQTIQFSCLDGEAVDRWNIPGWGNVLEVIGLSRRLSSQPSSSLQNYTKAELQKIPDAVFQDMRKKGVSFLEKLTLQQIDWVTQNDDGTSRGTFTIEEIKAARNSVQGNERLGTLQQLSFQKLRVDQLDGVSPKEAHNFLRSPGWTNFVSDEVLVAIVRKYINEKYVDDKPFLDADFYIQCAQNAKFHIIPTELRQKIDPRFFKEFTLNNFWEHLLPFVKLENNFIPTNEQFIDVIRGLKSGQLAECLPLFKVLGFALIPHVSADEIQGVPPEACRYLGALPDLTSEQIKNLKLRHFSKMPPRVFAQLWDAQLISSIRPKILKKLPLSHYSELAQHVEARGVSLSQIWTPKQYRKLPAQLFSQQMISLKDTPGRCLQKLTGTQFTAWLQGQTSSPNFHHSLPLETILKINPEVFAYIGNKNDAPKVAYLPLKILKHFQYSRPDYYQALHDHVRQTGTSFGSLWAPEQFPFIPAEFFSKGSFNPKEIDSANLKHLTSAQWDAWLSVPENDLKWLTEEYVQGLREENLSGKFLSKLSEEQMGYFPLKKLAKIPREAMQQFIASTSEKDQRIKYLISNGIVTEKEVQAARKNAGALSQNTPSDQGIADTIRQIGQNPDPATVQVVKKAYQKAEQVRLLTEYEQKFQVFNSDLKSLEDETLRRAQKAGDPNWFLSLDSLEGDSLILLNQKNGESLKVPVSDSVRIKEIAKRVKTTLQEFSSAMRAASQSRGGRLTGFGLSVMATVPFWIDLMNDSDKIKKMPTGFQLSLVWNMLDLTAGWVEDATPAANWLVKKFDSAIKEFSLIKKVSGNTSPGALSHHKLTFSQSAVRYFAKKGSSLAQGLRGVFSRIGPPLRLLNRGLGLLSLGMTIGELSRAQTKEERILAGTDLVSILVGMAAGHFLGAAAVPPLALAGLAVSYVVKTKLEMDLATKRHQARANDSREFLETQHQLYKASAKYREHFLFFQNARLRKIDLSSGEIIVNSQLVYTLRMIEKGHYYLPPKKLSDIYGFSESTILPENEAQKIQVVQLPYNTKQENLLIEEEDSHPPEVRATHETKYLPSTPAQRATEEILKNEGIITSHVRSLISRDQHPSEKEVPLLLKAPPRRNVVWMVPFEAKENKASYELETNAQGALNTFSYYAYGINLKLKDAQNITTPSLIRIPIGNAELFPEKCPKIENRDGKRLLVITHDNKQTSEIDITGITDSVIQLMGRKGIVNIYPDGKIRLQGCVIQGASDEVALKQFEKEPVVKIYPEAFALHPPSNSFKETSTETKNGVTTKITQITDPGATTIITEISGQGPTNPHGDTKKHTEVFPTPVDDPIHQRVQALYENYLIKITAALQTGNSSVFVDGQIIKNDRILPGAQFIENCESTDYYFFFHAETGTLQRIKKSNHEESRCQLPVKNGMPAQLIANGEQTSLKYVVPYGTEGKKVAFTYQWQWGTGPQLTGVEGVIVEQESASLPSRPTGVVFRDLSIKIPDAALADILKQAGIEQPIGRPQASTKKDGQSWVHFSGQDISGVPYNFDANLELGQVILLNKDDRLVAELLDNTSKGRIYHSSKDQSLLFVELTEGGKAMNNRQQPAFRIMNVREVTHASGTNLVCLISADGKQITLWDPFTDTKVILPRLSQMETHSAGIPRSADVLSNKEKSERRALSPSVKRGINTHPASLLALRAV